MNELLSLVKFIIRQIVSWYAVIRRLITDKRRILFYAYVPMNYTMFKSLHLKIEEISRGKVYFRLGVNPVDNYDEYIRLGVPAERILSHDEAMKRVWDVAIGADMPRPWLWWKTKFLQIGHGVAAKKVNFTNSRGELIAVDYRYHPELKEYDFVFFQNETDFTNARKLKKLKSENIGDVVGMCCLDTMMENCASANISRLKHKYIPSQYQDKKIILYAPTWDMTASYKQKGEEILTLLSCLDYFVIIKPHPNCVTSQVGSSGKDLSAFLADKFPNGNYILVTDTPYEVMPISDAMISDFSSISFEYCLLKKPIYLYEGKDYEQKIADMEQYELLKKCCFVFHEVSGLEVSLNSDCKIDEEKSKNIDVLVKKYHANIGDATNTAINKLLEYKIIIPRKK